MNVIDFIEKARLIHGNKYDYSKIEYKNIKTKIIIICSIHGEFKQDPHIHLRNHGCPKCGIIKNQNKHLHNNVWFIEKARLIHGNKYDYSKIEYCGEYKKIIIICSEHGEFLQTPNCHLYNHGCPQCGKIKSLNSIIKKSIKYKMLYTYITKQFIELAKKVHGNKYDYSKVNYKSSKHKIIIICKKHGEFLQRPNTHLSTKCGCPVCNESYGKRLIKQYLIINNIIFIKEKTFPGLIGVGGGLLRFDFYLPDYNICIEFDGPQHFNESFLKHYVGHNYNNMKNNDHKKSKYCKKYKIKLIRIPYYNKDKITEILKERISV